MNIVALYEVPDLAAAMGLSRQQVYRLVLNTGIQVQRAGRRVYVPISELQAKAPTLWESLVTAAALREACGGE